MRIYYTMSQQNTNQPINIINNNNINSDKNCDQSANSFIPDSNENIDEKYIVENWDELEVNEHLLRGIYAYGFEKPSPIQRKAIKPIFFW